MKTPYHIVTSVAVAVVMALVLLLAIVAFMVMRKKDKSKMALDDIQPVVETKKTVKEPIPSGPPTPLHHELKKDKTLQEEAKKLAQDEVLLKSEYSRLEEFVKENIIKETTVAKLEENKAHNRYLDIGLYLKRIQ